MKSTSWMDATGWWDHGLNGIEEGTVDGYK